MDVPARAMATARTATTRAWTATRAHGARRGDARGRAAARSTSTIPSDAPSDALEALRGVELRRASDGTAVTIPELVTGGGAKDTTVVTWLRSFG